MIVVVVFMTVVVVVFMTVVVVVIVFMTVVVVVVIVFMTVVVVIVFMTVVVVVIVFMTVVVVVVFMTKEKKRFGHATRLGIVCHSQTNSFTAQGIITFSISTHAYTESDKTPCGKRVCRRLQ